MFQTVQTGARRNFTAFAVLASVSVNTITRVFQIHIVGCSARPTIVARHTVTSMLAPDPALRPHELLRTSTAWLIHHTIKRACSTIHTVTVTPLMITTQSFKLRFADAQRPSCTSSSTRFRVFHHTRTMTYVILAPSACELGTTLAFRLVHFRHCTNSTILTIAIAGNRSCGRSSNPWT